MKKKSKQESICVTNPSKSKKTRFFMGEPGSLRSIKLKIKNNNFGEKNYVDHYHYLVRLVAAWLFRRKYQSKIPKNWKLDSYFTRHCYHTCHFDFTWGDLVPWFG
jgi:hypothetical protein